LLLAALALCACTTASAADAAQPPPPPNFTGTSLPEPPQQHAPWTPPATTLSGNFVSAVTTLFDQGLADPRGCEYREIEFVSGSVWGGTATVKTHGWILPSKPGDPQFAVAWNGLVYPVIKVGEPADLSADVLAAIANGHANYWHLPHAIPEGISASANILLPLDEAMLLRLGQVDLADKLSAHWDKELAQSEPDPYLNLSNDWAWAMFNRAVFAHMRGEDHLSFLDAQNLTRLQPLVNATSLQRGTPQPIARFGPTENVGKPISFLSFLTQLPELEADEQRRAEEKPVVRVLSAPDQYPDQSQRIAALIRDLEEVSARQESRPGGVYLGSDPIITALVKEGHPAVEPVIDCLANDDRLTRSVEFGGDYYSGLRLIRVNQAAYSALCFILQTNHFGPATQSGFYDYASKGKQAALAEIRAFWAKTKNLSDAERWFSVLADDQATPDQWIEAAKQITQFSNEVIRDGEPIILLLPPGESPALKGETLRAHKNPSVSDLLFQRLKQIDTSEGHGTFTNIQEQGADLAIAFARWDPVAAIPALDWQIADCQKIFDYWNKSGGMDVRQLDQPIGQLYAAASQTTSTIWGQNYAAWIKSDTPKTNSWMLKDVFSAMWMASDNPDVAAAADWLFNNSSSPWYSSPTLPDLARLPLISVPAYQNAVIRNLGDTTPIGSVKRTNDHVDLDITYHGQVIGSRYLFSESTQLPPQNVEQPMRQCDYWAWKLSDVDGFPYFLPWWPQEKRDATIAAMISFLNQYGSNYSYRNSLPFAYDQRWGPDAMHMAFPQRTQPASAQDVANGTAIFSLTGQTRAVPLNPFPLRIKWITQKDYPRDGGYFDQKENKEVHVTTYDQSALAWQAEEVLENGQWHRYYGLVGPHGIAKVPAEEIEIDKPGTN
jgi:hypothetical protein